MDDETQETPEDILDRLTMFAGAHTPLRKDAEDERQAPRTRFDLNAMPTVDDDLLPRTRRSDKRR